MYFDKTKIAIISAILSILPIWVFANNCSKTGYTITTINGVFGDEDEAYKNATNLSNLMGATYNSESLNVKYLFNPSHLGGINDIATAINQKIFDSETVDDYDFTEILKSASEKVTTQKLLIVGYSQGNFYANSLYDTVAGKSGGVPKESIGIYAVATPSDHVAGGGKWITSDTDKVITDIVARMPFKTIMKPNTHIELQEGDDFWGHDFSGVYLKYQSNRIVSDIESSLNNLSSNNIQDEQKSCIDPPEITLAHIRKGSILAVGDSIMNTGKEVIVSVATELYQTGTLVVKTGAQVAEATGNFFNSAVEATANMVDAVGGWFLGSVDNNSQFKKVSEINLNGKALVADAASTILNSDSAQSDSGAEKEVQNSATEGITANSKSNSKSRTVKFGDPSKDTQDEDLAEAQSKAKDDVNNKNEPAQINVATNQEAATKQPKICTFDTNKTPSHQNLIINEVAWMGGANSANDEWFELKNISGSDLDISGWQILDKKEDIKIILDLGTKILSNGLLLFERTDDNSIPDIKADFIYSGALSNSDEGLRVFDSECNLTDEVLADPSWPAGEASSRRTMERQSDLSWKVYSGNGENGIFGTPKKENSQQLVSSGSSAVASSPVVEAIPDSPPKIIISEVQISGTTANDEFIELFNIGNEAVDLTGWSVKKKSSSGTESTLVSESRLEGKSIPAKGYFLVANESGYSSSVAADVLWPKSYSIASDNTILLYAPDKSVAADKVGFGKAQDFESAPALNPAAGQTISRISQNDTDNNASDFVLSNPTPKNSSVLGGFLSSAVWSSSSPVSSVGNLLISEIFIDMNGADQEEFIEIYNPTDLEISLKDWSLQYLSGDDAASLNSLAKKNFSSSSSIKSKRFYLVAMGSYEGEKIPDMTWSQSLNNTGATVFLVSTTTLVSGIDDSSIIDHIAYGTGSGILLAEGQVANLPPVGQSLERKPFSNNVCILVSEGGVLGNGCDTDDNLVDFEVRVIRDPQNSQNFPEPRIAPTIPVNLNIGYGTTTLKANLTWGESSDFSGATSTMKYVISYATSSQVSKELGTVNSANTYEFFPKEIEIDSQYSVVAKDKEGMLSEAAKINLNTPDFLSDLDFFKNATDSSYYIDLGYDKYPFVSDAYSPGFSTWKILVFYLNQDAPDEVELNTQNNWTPENTNGVLKTIYKRCSGGSYSPSFSLILPDSADRCSAGGGVGNSALDFNEIKDNHLPLKLDIASTTVFTNQDFITVGYYSFYQSGGGSQRFRVAALSRKKYFFSE